MRDPEIACLTSSSSQFLKELVVKLRPGRHQLVLHTRGVVYRRAATEERWRVTNSLESFRGSVLRWDALRISRDL